jgi:hypothetical protein
VRHPLRGVAAIAASIALLAPVASAGAKTTKSYCHPGGDYCVAVIKHEGMTKLRITTPSLTSNYGLCVRRTVNGTHECHHFRFKQKAGGLQESRVDVQSRFGGPPSGHYCATWRYGGAKLHTLCFNYTRLLSRGL